MAKEKGFDGTNGGELLSKEQGEYLALHGGDGEQESEVMDKKPKPEKRLKRGLIPLDEGMECDGGICP
ncbi:MAG: hypothetical protein V1804_03395 [Patescibacteria group bacterium]